MPTVPVPTDVMPKSVSTAAAAPQIDARVLSSIGAGGRAMGNAVSALGEAFGEVIGKVGQVQDEQNYADAKLAWIKGDFGIQQDLQANTAEDGEYLKETPRLYGDLNKSIDDRYKINDPKKRRDFEQWRELQTFSRGKQSVIGYQGAQAGVFKKGYEGQVADLEYRIQTGMITPDELEQYHKGLNDKVDGMDSYVINRAQADDIKYKTGGRIIRSLEEAMLTPGHKLSDPKAALDFGNIVKKLRWELDEIPGAPGRPSGPLKIEPVPGGSLGRGRRSEAPQGIIVHHTAGSSLEGAIEHGRKSGTGANYYVVADPQDPNNAKIVQGAPDDQYTAHIQPPNSRYRNGNNANLSSQNTYGIEVVAPNDRAITPGQRAITRQLVAELAQKNGIKPENIRGHGSIQGGPGGNREREEGAWIERAEADYRLAQGPRPVAERGAFGRGVTAQANTGTANDASPAGVSAPRQVTRREDGTVVDMSGAPIETGTVDAPAAEKPANPLGFLGDDSRSLSDLNAEERIKVQEAFPGERAMPEGNTGGLSPGYVRQLFGSPEAEEALNRLTVGDLRKGVGQAGRGEVPGDLLGPAAERIFGTERAGQLRSMINEQGPDTPLGHILEPDEIAELSARFPQLGGGAWQDMTIGEALQNLTVAPDSGDRASGAESAARRNPTEGYAPKIGSNDFPRGRLVPGQEFELVVGGQKFRLTSDMVNAAGGPDARRLYEKRAKEINDAAQHKNESLGKNRWIPQAEYDMKYTGRLPEGYSDQLAIMKQTFIKHPEVIEQHFARMKIAQQVYRTFQGANELPFDTLRRRVDELAPAEDDPDRVEKAKAFDEAEKRLLKLEGLRMPGTPKYDPVEFFDPNPTVMKTLGIRPTAEILKLRKAYPGGKGQPENTLQGHELISKRVDTELAGGVAPEHVRPLSRRETDELEANIRASNPKEEGFVDAIKKTNEDVKKKYGERYSGLIMKQIMDEIAEKSRKHGDGPDILRGLESDGVVHPLTLPALREFENQEKALAPPPKPPARTWGDTAKDALRYGAQGLPSTRTLPAPDLETLKDLRRPRIFGGEGRPRIEPEKEEIQKLESNPGYREEFERKHGMPRGEGLKYLLPKRK